MNRATVERGFLKITKRFAKLGGLWPTQNKSVKVILWAIVDISLVSSVITQTARIIHTGTLNVVIEQSSLIGATILMIIKHGNYVLNAAKLKSLLNDMFKDWAADRSKGELEIMTTYANRASFMAKFYFVNACIMAIIFIQMPWTARLFHMIKQENTSPPVIYSIPGYYFVEDDRDYYYCIQMHMILTVFVVAIVFVSCDTFYMVLVQHGCGLLTVAGYCFKNAVKKDSSIAKHSETKAKEIHKCVWYSIQSHQKAITFLEKIESAHVTYFLFTMGIIVVCVSITMVQVAVMEVCFDFYKFTGFLLVQFLHLCFLTMQGQFVINSFDEMYDAIYEALWYNTHPKTQELYMLALRRNLTPPRLTAGGLIELNMESFSQVLKLCASYYTVLKTV